VTTNSPASPVVIEIKPLGFPWPTLDPFLVCVLHDDRYPRGNDRLGPAASLSGRDLGQDFAGKDGWRMYHGQVVPGFPQHPHRGFETVTVARRGFIDHSDSLGATARYGQGDVQWLTAGRGVVHAEMFPLLEPAAENPLELFQIWLNLPASRKMCEPHFSMFWHEAIPRVIERDAAGHNVEVTLVAGRLGAVAAPAPPPHSWAAAPGSGVQIWTLKLAPGASWTLPAAAAGSVRSLYYFRGSSLQVEGQHLPGYHAAVLQADRPARLDNGAGESELLLLSGQPIGEPVVQYGPFVMNSRAEIQQAFADYQRTRFGGWPWPSDDPVHPRDAGRFARQASGETRPTPLRGRG
jgi:redox-sensitive bicupin YhaK (pirin superfamily)